MSTLTTIGFDADDTLWDHEKYFVDSKTRYLDLLAPYVDVIALEARLHETETANVSLYGFGVKSFTLSMIEAALATDGGDLPSPCVSDILQIGRELLVHPVDPYPGVHDTLDALRSTHKLLVVTRGDLVDQERKLAASGLLGYFHEIEIVSDKTPQVYSRIFTRHGDGPRRAMMVGNSMRADVVPAIEAGCFGIHIPSDYVWSMDIDSDPQDISRFRRLTSIADVAAIVAEIG
ncbi:MAG: HAD family hydrolase [Devosia sp. 67-54]|uniref:HAD family hydrolase n=1 Tax=unclassified Devosia TaxID=196773 RepID=UPI00086B51E9|nr:MULTISPECIES: HAD family hydrolase [unclassified Devosia]MBN9307071.1 HAD family hydrolase [Devosia sp.]ODU62393.1 MAG: HAD family hydrolase [Pelagibacterium sp. SCN 68-10]OJX19480.1 MAG: HAD family hydrolase [Devosia sp. 67-54]